MFKVSTFIGFAIGALVGSVITHKLMKDKCNDEIQEVRNVWESSKKENESEKNPSGDISRNNSETNKYKSTLKKENYVDYSRRSSKEVIDKPYVITPDEFGELLDEGYSSIRLDYFKDGTLAEDADIVDDVANTIGKESLNHFDEYEEDTVYVRNDRLKCDFLVCKVDKTYAEHYRAKPPKPFDRR